MGDAFMDAAQDTALVLDIEGHRFIGEFDFATAHFLGQIVEPVFEFGLNFERGGLLVAA